MQHFSKNALLVLMSLAMWGLGNSAHAGRPLAVDDANVNEKGAGHVEVWVARASPAKHHSPLKQTNLDLCLSVKKNRKHEFLE